MKFRFGLPLKNLLSWSISYNLKISPFEMFLQSIGGANHVLYVWPKPKLSHNFPLQSALLHGPALH